MQIYPEREKNLKNGWTTGKRRPNSPTRRDTGNAEIEKSISFHPRFVGEIPNSGHGRIQLTEPPRREGQQSWESGFDSGGSGGRGSSAMQGKIEVITSGVVFNMGKKQAV